MASPMPVRAGRGLIAAVLACALAAAAGCSSARHTRFVISPADVGRTARPELRRADAGRLRFFTGLYANYMGYRDLTEEKRSPDLIAWWAAGRSSSSSFLIARADGEDLVLYVHQRRVLIDAWPFVERRATWDELTESLRRNLSQAYHGRIREDSGGDSPSS